MTETASAPSGVVAILTRADGHVVTTAPDFDHSRPGGFSLREAQTARARRALANQTVRALCSEDIADVIHGYEAERILDGLVRVKGYRVTVTPVGPEEI